MLHMDLPESMDFVGCPWAQKDKLLAIKKWKKKIMLALLATFQFRTLSAVKGTNFQKLDLGKKIK